MGDAANAIEPRAGTFLVEHYWPGVTPAEFEAAARSVRASAETLAFMTVDYRSMPALMKKVLAGATGEFKTEYTRSAPQLRSAVLAQQSVSSGRVLSVAVSTVDKDSATAFIAADSQVSNKGTKGSKVPRYYRLQMDLAKVKGRWLVSKLQFVG